MFNVRFCVRIAAVLFTVNTMFFFMFNWNLMRQGKSIRKYELQDGIAMKNVLDTNLTSNEDSEKISISYFKMLNREKGLWDRSRVFKIYPFVTTAENWSSLSSEWNVCMSTQTSVDHMFWLVEQTKTWTGPISVSVFVPDVDYTICLIMIQYLSKCHPSIMKQVTFHLVYPNVMPPQYVETDVLEYDCTRPEDVNKELIELIRTAELIKTLEVARYPQNLMRNTARQGCQSTFCFTPDIDMITIPNFGKKLNAFLGREEVQECKKCAFILPTYEISIKAPSPPTNKKELIRYIKKRYARRFHIRVFKNNQANSKLNIWEKLKVSDKLSIAYNITTWGMHWEPIYITKSNVPPFDERFIGYGFTRNSQVYEMRVAGYSWHMLDNAFLNHRGFQSKRSQSKSRRVQISENNQRYDIFMRELQQHYGVTNDPALEKTKHVYRTQKKKGNVSRYNRSNKSKELSEKKSLSADSNTKLGSGNSESTAKLEPVKDEKKDV